MNETRVAIAGLGAIGRTLAKRLADGMPGLSLACAAARDRAKAQAWLDAEEIDCPLVELDAFRPMPISRSNARRRRSSRRSARRCSRPASASWCSAPARCCRGPDLVALAQEHGGQIIVPTGALLGLDAVAAAAEGDIHSVRMITRKPPNGLEGAPYLVEHGISVAGLNTAKLVFSGTAREAAAGFPGERQRGGGALARRHRPRPHHDRDLGRPRGEPQLPRDRGRRGFGAKFSLSIENIPSENPKTGRITALSVIAALRKLNAPLRVGT